MHASRDRWSALYEPKEKRIFLSTLYMMMLNFQNIEFPWTLKNVTKFECLKDVSINVYNTEGQKTLNILPIRLADDKKEKHVNLLFARSATMWAISYGARICLGSWARNWVNIMVKSIFAIGKYMINKSEFFFKKKLTLFIFICSCLHYFHSNEKLQSYMIDWWWINDCYPTTEQRQ